MVNCVIIVPHCLTYLIFIGDSFKETKKDFEDKPNFNVSKASKKTRKCLVLNSVSMY